MNYLKIINLRNFLTVLIALISINVFSSDEINEIKNMKIENLKLQKKLSAKESEYNQLSISIKREIEEYNSRLERLEKIKNYKEMILSAVEEKGIEKISENDLSRYHLIKREEMLQNSVENIGHAFTIFSTFLALISIFLGGVGYIFNNKLKEAKEHLDEFKTAQKETMDFNNYMSKKRHELEEQAHKYREHYEDSRKMIQKIENGTKASKDIDKLIEEQNQRILELEKFGVTLSYRDLYDRAEAEKVKNNYMEALLLINKSIELEPDYIYSLYLKIDILIGLNKADEVRELVNILKARDKNNGTRLSSLGHSMSKVGDHTAALTLYDEALKLEPTLFATYINRAISYTHLNQFDKAGEDLKRASTIKPNDKNLMYNFGCYYARVKNNELALDYLKKAIDMDDKYIEMAHNDPDFECLKDCNNFIEMTKRV
ncbi:tetratricopeptide repeat protein [Halobacteriovorax sp. RT-2-4]|uniref:tetratricopeptide repeat protein n=1 Tax=unclassified Halobacteriovorax TaxID=2639665 RepID=UPI00399AFA4E